MIPAGHAMRALLAPKLWGTARKSHVMSQVFDDGLALFSSVSDYERDHLRLHADVILAIATFLDLSTDEPLGRQPVPRAHRVTDSRLLERMALIERLPKRDRDALLRTINAFLSKAA
jgi:hypothetical protein